MDAKTWAVFTFLLAVARAQSTPEPYAIEKPTPELEEPIAIERPTAELEPIAIERPSAGLEPNTTATSTFYEGELPTINVTPNATLVGNSTENMTAFQIIMRANDEVARDKLEVHEFDMRFPVAQSDASDDQHDAPIRDRSALWPGGVIPYVFGNSIRNQIWFQKLIKGAMSEWEAKTCIMFRRRKSHDSNYVLFHIGNGCNSDVGMVGGRQTVSLGTGCAHHSVVLHELGHVVGFWHEQNRPDRDRYVKIIRENIIDKLYFAFRKYSTHKINSLGVPYDYKSIMHYARNAFSKNRRDDTIVSRDGKTRNFGNNHLSSLDILQANRLYKCPDKNNLYPSFPKDFVFSFSRLSGHKCTWLYEPHDRYWRRVYLCVKSDRRLVNIRWSNKGAIPRMTCTRIYSEAKHYYLGWNDNYLCVPKKSYKFIWSTNGPLSGYPCMQWRYTRDRRWGRNKYLCANKSDEQVVHGRWSPWSLWNQCTKKCGTGFQQRKRECTNPRPKNGGRSCGSQSYETRYCNSQECDDLPKWPEDFTYRYHPYTPSSSTCIRTYERANYFQWTNYYFCSRSGRRDINMKWSDNGPIRNMKCVLINEPREPRQHGWNNNYLCVPRRSPYRFRWSHSGQINGLECIQWLAKRGLDGWNDNYLCADKFNGGQPTVSTTTRPQAIHGGWTTWGAWTTCTKSCGRGRRRRYRSCANPYPSNGGRTCSGAREIREYCNQQECPRECYQKYTEDSGSFRAPQNKKGSFTCSWTIEVPIGYKVRLYFRSFTVGGGRPNCLRGADYVTIREGQDENSLLINSLCGSFSQRYIYSSGNKMRVTLRSANIFTRPSFHVSWMAIAVPTRAPTRKTVEECGGILRASRGNISSPNFPKNYPARKECTWIIKVPVHKLLKLRFVSFDVENHATCGYDYVQVRDGATSRSKLLGTFCGKTLPKQITAFANSLWIKFRSDGNKEFKGFRAEYRTKQRNVGCGAGRWKHYVSEEDNSEYCYLIRYRRMTWDAARRDCQRKKNSDLLSIATKKEQWFVRNELMAETRYYELWMGYNDRTREGQWAWSDKSQVNFKNWGGGDPNNGGQRKNEDCGVVKPDGKWNDFPCNHRFMYICKRKIS
ncbi:uncharacterized protein LOC114518347 [Dendronephthya gigantea]|uniref:uncharacterized protein LOC114518347 n=1 Tax=Dendronephthya gigantea TaxID=151771 RepID=UPI00106CDDB1|nr:uncharacterized protein LOC114518347 [Dendronephthya gigantea]